MPAVMRAVADDGDHAPVLAALRAAATAMPRAALIEVLEWPTPKVSYSLSARAREGREAAVLLDGVQPVAAAGQHLVRIGLVADVPHQPVVRACRRRSAGRSSARRCPGPAAKWPPRVLTLWIRNSRSSLRQRRQLGRRTAGAGPPGVAMESSSGYLSGAAGHRRVQCTPARDAAETPITRRKRQHRLQLDAARRRSRASSARAAAARPSGASAAIAAIAQLRGPARARRPVPRCSGRSACCARHRRRWTCRAAPDRLRRRGCRPGSGRRDRSRRRSASSASSSAPPSTPAARAPSSTLPSMSAPVLRRCMFSIAATRQRAARPRRDRPPGRRPCRRCRWRAPARGSSPGGSAPRCRSIGSSASTAKASACSASPTRIAVASS